MKLYVNREYVGNRPWGGGAKFSDCVLNTFKDDTVRSIWEADTALIVGIGGDGPHLSGDDIADYKRKYNTQLRIVLRVNDCDKRKNTKNVDKRIASVAQVADHVVFVSQWMKDYFTYDSPHSFVHKIHPNATVIVNGCDGNVFKADVHESVKLHNDGRIHAVYHSWSDNDLKGRDGIEFMRDFQRRHSDTHSFTFIGRTKVELPRATHVQPLSGRPLANVLALHDVYVFFSRFDPGPNACLEALSLGLPTYAHIDSGGGAEFVGQDHTFLNFDDLEKLLLLRQFKHNDTVVRSWEDVMKDYERVLRNV